MFNKMNVTNSMTALFQLALRSMLTLTLLVGVVACGSSSDDDDGEPSPDTFSIGGNITNLNEEEVLKLALNAEELGETLTLQANGTFSFTNELEDNTTFSIEIFEQPLNQVCRITISGEDTSSGNVSQNSIDSLSVTCIDRTFSVGGQVNGLGNDEELKLALLSGDIEESLSITSNGDFNFDNLLASETSYNVSISHQPENQRCSISSESGSINSEDVTNIYVSCVDIAKSVSGTLSIAVHTTFDSDLNDPLAPYSDNSSFSTAQDIGNLSSIQGFLTKQATGFSGDRYETSTDVHDFYRVSLQAGQVIQMQVINFTKFNLDGRYAGDLDLALHDANGKQVAVSQSVNEYETLTIEEGGIYYLNPYAYAGTSKYIIKILSGANNAIISSNDSYYAHSLNFNPKEAIIKLSETNRSLRSHKQPSSTKRSATSSSATNSSDTQELAFTESDRMLSSARKSHSSTKRAALASLDFSQLDSSNPASSLRQMKGARTAHKQPDENWEKFETLRQIKRMNDNPDVAYAEPNFIRYASKVPNDEYYNLQWHYPAMNLPQAWEYSTGTPNSGDVIVAVIDTGVYLNHPDLSNKLVPGYDFISDAGNALDGNGIDSNPDDPGDSNFAGQSSWHGTHVAGTIAAESNNSDGIAGVSWGAKIMPVRVLGQNGGSNYDLIQAIRFAAGLENDSGILPAQKADIINMSLGGPGSSFAEASVIQEAYDNGVVIVAAAGNESSSQLSYPASYDGVISVSAIDASENLAPYSNFGSRIDIAAPGGNIIADIARDGQPDGILSAIADDSSGTRIPAYQYYQGTSMAAPHVAGMIALMKAIHPELTPQDVETLLQNGDLTRDAGAAGRDNSYGHGIADALSAVQSALALQNGSSAPELPPSIVASPTSANLDDALSSVVTISNQGGGSPGIVSITENADWLEITALSVDARGLGDYQLAVDRTGLIDGIYIEPVDFDFGNGNSVRVQVTMTVGVSNSSAELSRLYPVLVDPSANDGEGETITLEEAPTVDPVVDGTATYRFTNVPHGSYYIFIGTDIDNDLKICQGGEGCGAYPSINQPSLVEINTETIDKLDLVVDIIAGITNISASSVGDDFNTSTNSDLDSGITRHSFLETENDIENNENDSLLESFSRELSRSR